MMIRKVAQKSGREIVPILMSGGIVYVELSEVNAPATTASKRTERGGEFVSAVEPPQTRLKNMLMQMTTTLKEALDEIRPDEVSFEAKIGFAGKTSPVPFLVSVGSDAVFSVKVTWKRND
jgi:hypothetical protein